MRRAGTGRLVRKTVKGDGKPEFDVFMLRRKGRVHASLHRFGGWHDPGSRRKCAALEAARGRGGDVLLVVPRWCLRRDGRKPPAVRVVVWSSDEPMVENDWAPGRRFARRWVAAG